jgi:poly(beta-D-mannuronate) lyase
VESAASNHVFPTLPYGSTTGSGGSGSSGGGFTGSPAAFLNFGGIGGYWNVGIGYPTGHVDISYAELTGGFTDSPYFVMNAAGTAVVFWVPMNGGRTSSNTKYPRTELRELKSDGVTKASWSGTTGHHRLQGKSKVMHYAPIKCEMVVGQIHDATQDALQLRAEATSATASQTWRLSIFGSEVKDLISGVSLGQEVSWDVDVNAGALTVKINGTSQWSSTPGFISSGNYFKAGAYTQQNSTDQANSPSDYASVELRDLILTHS